MQERRQVQRIRTLKSGHVVIDTKMPALECIVRNLSARGALLLVPSLAVPDRFELVLDSSRARHDCRVAWRAMDRVGIEFVSAGTAAGADPSR